MPQVMDDNEIKGFLWGDLWLFWEVMDVTQTRENLPKEDTEITQFIQTNGDSFVLALGGIVFPSL